MIRTIALATFLLLASAAPAAARDEVVRSFDGTELHISFFPAKAGKRAPTVLMTHGWAGRRERTPNAALHDAGFNILTWDSRGFGDSGGTVTIDHWKNEGRDVRVLLNWLARQKEAKLDKRRDPRVGMYGGSYAGGIQYVAAAIDRRIDAITPSIAWHSLLTSLYREETLKGGWASILYGAGQATGRLDPHIASAFGSGTTTGTLSAEDRAWFKSRGPAGLVKRIKVPTLILQGTPDTLFTPSEAIDNWRTLRRKRVPVKMLWFCGGHGTCLTGEGTAGHVERRAVDWLERYVMRRKRVRTGPRFEWLADDAVWRGARSFPPRAGTPVVGNGSGTLVVTPADTSGSPTYAGPATNAVNVAIPEATAQVVGRPRVRLTYSGTGTATHVFAQIVDESRNVVLGNQVTPIRVRLDGASHTITRSLEGVAASLAPGRRYRLQIIGGTQVYGPARGAGTIAFSAARISLPAISP
jgi:ABC-2 type transport system ATP-binding protein